MYQTTRAEVMEKGVAIEAGISGIIGYILNIYVDTSTQLRTLEFEVFVLMRKLIFAQQI